MADNNPIFQGLPPEYQAQLDEAARRQRLAQFFQQQSLGFKGAQSQGALASKTSPLAWLAHAATGVLAGYNEADAAQQGAKVRTKFGADQTAELGRIQGLPDETQRITEGQKSQFPLAQQMAKALFDERNKRINAAIPVAGQASPDAAMQIASTGNLPTAPLPPELVTVNSQRVPKTTMGDFGDKFSPPGLMAPGGGLPPLLIQANSRSGKVEALDKAPKISMKVDASQKGENSFTEQLGKDVAGAFKEARSQAESAYATKGVIGQMQELEKKGVFSGPAANVQTTLASFARSLGMPVDTAKLANSQAYQQQFAKQIGQYLTNSSLGRTLTDADRKALEDAFPQLIQSPEGRAQIYMQLNNAADTAIARHQSFQKQLLTAYPEQKGMLALNPVDLAPGRGVNPAQTPVAPANASPSVANPASPPPPANGKAYTMEEFNKYFGNGR